MSKSEKRQREKLVKCRCTDAEFDAITKKAFTAGLTTSEYIRRCALNRRIMVRTDIRMMNELLRLGGLQKHLFNQMQDHMTTELSRQFSEVLTSITHTINALDMTPVPAESLKDK
ncbi:plasmid mobilization protein MobA [Cronobacter sakazakii]|uniref:Mobilization protein n=1 Tax=Cronobacter sakazakii TaxID=28141 RepID=A0AA45BYD0_CROSK|nr:plasmid mobilization protein MobA [Cronobacter sakazakii]PUW01543.1 mobilization protein [Cronobacter sakazakii]